jgi:hypothetical protein
MVRGICIYYGSPIVPAKAATTRPGVYYGSSLVPAKAAATIPGVYYGSSLAPAKAAATLPGVQQNKGSYTILKTLLLEVDQL